MGSQNEKFAAIAAARAAAAKAGTSPAVAAAKAAASKKASAPLREVTTGITTSAQDEATKTEADVAAAAAAKAHAKAERNAAREERAKARAAAKLAKDVRKQQLADIRKEQRALKAKGAKQTAEDKARLAELKVAAHAVRGTGRGKPRLLNLLTKVERLLGMMTREAGRYTITTERGDAFDAHAVLLGLGTSTRDAKSMVETAEVSRKVKATSGRNGAAAKPKVVAGSTVTVKAKFFDTYEDVLNVADKFTVTKVVGKRAVVVDSEGTKSALPLAHLEVA